MDYSTVTTIPHRRVNWTPLAARRKAAYLSQADLARALGVSRTTVWRIETGRTCPSLAFALTIAAAMGANLFQLVEVSVPAEPRRSP